MLFHERWDERFQSGNAPLDRSLALQKQCQSKPGELLLQDRDLGFQISKPLDQTRLKC